MKKGIAILGSTGSIGRQTLEVVESFAENLEVHVLVAGSNIELFSQQILAHKPKIAVIAKEELLPGLLNKLGKTNTRVLAGERGIIEAIALPEIDTVVAAISGAAGLKPTFEAIKLGKSIALANKETLVAAGQVVMKQAQKRQVKILPVDSEHSAIFQCLQNQAELVENIILTASGGPFRGWKKEQLTKVTPAMALKHPNWSMGCKITVDSATLINKGLEVIEAHWLFNMPYEKIEVLVHPQSIIHSLVGFKDGSTLAQLGLPDMRLPIQYALAWPTRWENNWERLELKKIGELTFEEPDFLSFPGLKLAYEVGKTGGTAPCIFNAANEEAVRFFLQGVISFTQITELIEFCLDKIGVIADPDLDEILATDVKVREVVARRF